MKAFFLTNETWSLQAWTLTSVGRGLGSHIYRQNHKSPTREGHALLGGEADLRRGFFALSSWFFLKVSQVSMASSATHTHKFQRASRAVGRSWFSVIVAFY